MRIKVIKRIYISYTATRNLGKGCYRQCIFKYISYAKRLPCGNIFPGDRHFFAIRLPYAVHFCRVVSRLPKIKNAVLTNRHAVPRSPVYSVIRIQHLKRCGGAPARPCKSFSSNVRRYCRRDEAVLPLLFCGSWRGRGDAWRYSN